MNGKKAKHLRKLAKALAEVQETTYIDTNKKMKSITQRLSPGDMKKRKIVDENGKVDISKDGFLKSGVLVNDLLVSSVNVCIRVLDPKCFRSKYKNLKKHWVEVLTKYPMVERKNFAG